MSRIVDGLNLGYTRAEIKLAKEGVHLIAWSPGGPKHPCVVTKVRGFHAWVCQLDADAESQAFFLSWIKLNLGASDLLMKGGYRVG